MDDINTETTQRSSEKEAEILRKMYTVASVAYKLGERTKWSEHMPTGCAHRYVDVQVMYANGRDHVQTLEIPEQEAYRLCTAMGNFDLVEALVEPAIEEDKQSLTPHRWICLGREWVLPGLLRLLVNMARVPFQGRLPAALKYIELRIDMRDGAFTVKNNNGEEALPEVMALLKAHEAYVAEAKSEEKQAPTQSV